MRRVRGRSALAVEGSPDEAAGRFRFLRGLFPRGDEHGQRAIANRVRMTTDALPMLLLANVAVAGALSMLRWPLGDAAAILTIVLPLAVLLAAGGGVMFLGRRSNDRTSPELMHGIVALFGLVQGCSWSAWIIGAGQDMASPQWPLVAIAYSGLLVVSTLVFAPVPTAALVLWLALSIAAGIAAGSWTAPLLLLPLLAIGVVALGGLSHGSHVASRRWLATAAKALKAAVLLREFEESHRGWFWETDAGGLISYISPELATALGLSVEHLLGTPMTSLVLHELGERRTGDGERTLGFHLSTRLAFSEIAVRAVAGEDVRWWSLSGRPAFDEFGVFLGFRGSGTDLTEMRRSEAEVKRLASYDPLTGLPNRILMRRTLDESLRDVAGRPKRTALLMLDLDRFKSVNDTLGHPVGDVLLRHVAERLQRVVHNDGQVGRLGGDEFNVVLPGLDDKARIETLATAIIDAISKPYLLDDSHVSIGVSIGIALAPDDGATADALVRNADLALYAAKAQGKGVCRFYEPEMHASAKERRLLEMDLRNVMSDSGLHLAYQPVVDAQSEAIVCFEALVRWNHPTRGMVSPSDFIPIAEEIGLIAQIGEWVLRTACLEAANWPESVRIAVNISPIQFANPSLPGLVMSALAAAQLAPHRLELEITEGVFLTDDPATDAMFARLKAIGVRFALDDFGTGYSSLGYLKKAPFNKIKIDQSFVRGAAVPGNRNAAIIRAIVALAESLGMETTAEGAETAEELALIRSLGCSHIQGYIFGRPMLSDEARMRVAGSSKLAMPGLHVTRDPRVAVLRTATFSNPRGKATGRIRNLSRTGAMIECSIGFRSGEPVTIDFGDGQPVKGVIRWCDEDRFGVVFDEPIDTEQLNPQRMVRSAAG